jgi:hypothetical protein
MTKLEAIKRICDLKKSQWERLQGLAKTSAVPEVDVENAEIDYLRVLIDVLELGKEDTPAKLSAAINEQPERRDGRQAMIDKINKKQ